jgi:DNA-binding response OmpR family regulator
MKSQGEPCENAGVTQTSIELQFAPDSASLAGMRVLIVEDEPDLLKGLAKALREEGYAVDTAADGEDGLFKAANADYDAIVLDIMLPRLNGWEILKRLRAKKSTPVLMLTARDATADRVRGLDTGADDYVVKPFDLPELLARLRALIRRGARTAQPAIKIGRVEINTGARSVTAAGKPVASRRTRHPHDALRTSLRRKRGFALESARRSRLESPQETRPGPHRHPSRPRLHH